VKKQSCGEKKIRGREKQPDPSTREVRKKKRHPGEKKRTLVLDHERITERGKKKGSDFTEDQTKEKKKKCDLLLHEHAGSIRIKGFHRPFPD